VTEYIFFDLDGTLTDPSEGITNSVIYALERFGIKAPPREELYKFIGPPLVESFKKYYAMSEKEAQRALSVYREYFSVKGLYENAVYPGIKELLQDLQESGFKLVLASSKPEVYVKRILEHFDLDKYFYFIGGSDLEEKRVEKPKVIDYCLESISRPATEKCIMVGDRMHDILGAKAHQMSSVGVLYGFGSIDELKDAGADTICRSPEELKYFLLGLKARR